jgi:molybdopterin-containing oxidoreductase family iron-sulfur binding subunit
MARYGMLIDLNRCIGCKSCAVACQGHHALPPGVFWGWVETDFKQDPASIKGRRFPKDGPFLPLLCMHCDDPPCLRVCPTGATFRRDDGLVLIDYERCIGCRRCLVCPYGARHFNWVSPQEAFEEAFKKAGYEGLGPEGVPFGDPLEHRVDGGLIYTPKRSQGVVEKCTFCVEVLDRGLMPVCVRACPANARAFGDLDDPLSDIAKRFHQPDTLILLAQENTRPKVAYKPVTSSRPLKDA